MTKKASRLQARICLLLLTLVLLAPLVVRGQNSPSVAKRPIAVADAIGMTRLEIADYLAPNPGQVAHFSPDGKRFVLALRKGNLEQGTNDFSLLLYQTADALHSPRAEVLLKMSSSSARDAISQVCWLADSDTLFF